MPHSFGNQKLIPHLSAVVFLLLALFLAGCSSQPKIPTPEEQEQKLAEVMNNGGYNPARKYTITSYQDVWLHDQTQLDIVMTAPTEPGHYPLIIYLPSLGENASAGQLWRETWAQAGYAVFSVQPQAISQALKEIGQDGRDKPGEPNGDDDENDNDSGKDGKHGGKSSRSGRNSEIRFLGHEYFAVDALKSRMEQVYWAYHQLKMRVASATPGYASVDNSKVVLAGYDLGAQTVAAILGERFAVSLPKSTELNPSAAIVLSPSIDLAEGEVRSRFQNLNMPLLVITGSEDNDPYAISSASVRSAVWEFSPANDKYLLLLKGDVHALLAGKEKGGRFGLNNGQGGDKGGFGGWGGGARHFQPANQYGSSGGHGHGQNGGGTGGGHKDEGEHKNADLGYKQVAAVFSATSAFLDKVLKNDEFAQFWIDEKANNWLDRAGVLKIR